MTDAKATHDRDRLIRNYFRAVNHGFEQTESQQESQLREFFEWLDAEGVTIEGAEEKHVKYYLSDTSERVGPSAVSDRGTTIRRFYDELIGDDELKRDDNPVTEAITEPYHKDSSKKEREGTKADYWVSPDEAEAMFANPPSPAFRNELLLRLLWETGVRRTELANIKTAHIKREIRAIEVTNAKDSDGDGRDVYFSPSTGDMLDEWVGVRRDTYAGASDSPYLFPTQRSERIHEDQISRIVRKAASEDYADVQRVIYTDADGRPRRAITPHAFRHGFAVCAVREDYGDGSMDITRLADILGHDDLETTRWYLKFRDKARREAARRFSPAGGH